MLTVEPDGPYGFYRRLQVFQARSESEFDQAMFSNESAALGRAAYSAGDGRLSRFRARRRADELWN
ncbi:MAG: hypothetical protein WAN75_26105, partial [Xanthobacteraceae bacterium]